MQKSEFVDKLSLYKFISFVRNICKTFQMHWIYHIDFGIVQSTAY